MELPPGTRLVANQTFDWLDTDGGGSGSKPGLTMIGFRRGERLTFLRTLSRPPDCPVRGLQAEVHREWDPEAKTVRLGGN